MLLLGREGNHKFVAIPNALCVPLLLTVFSIGWQSRLGKEKD